MKLFFGLFLFLWLAMFGLTAAQEPRTRPGDQPKPADKTADKGSAPVVVYVQPPVAAPVTPSGPTIMSFFYMLGAALLAALPGIIKQVLSDMAAQKASLKVDDIHARVVGVDHRQANT